MDGAFYICRRSIPHIRPGGTIVTIASSAAHEGCSPEHVHYGASKGGVLAFTKSLARELSPNIRVNTVSPGTIDTPMVAELLRQKGGKFLATTPAGRFGTGEEVGNAVAFLCSTASSYIMGQAIHVNGGAYMGG
ncbi:SDR family oxidoreductase [Mesorhizobium japonicum]|uniref:SDR family NAD(P)-dependent oxidoreductase n=1 Tax=Mesorhizobium TaxID=68287 RepID=UPI0009EE0DBF|nr:MULTISPECIES: SDR family oxidoreductase [Mesorhizobium]MUT24782.1 SDR family oxidoreductase [Mesorhizobium japonicum]